jgi:E3 ubiquitin-protein ligase DOA10
MSNQEEFFSKKHNQLLIIAVWAKYLAWVVLIFYSVSAISNVVGNLYTFSLVSRNFQGITYLGLIELIEYSPEVAIKYIFEAVTIILKGVVLFYLLKGLALGLNMVVETDINYREKINQGGEQ